MLSVVNVVCLILVLLLGAKAVCLIKEYVRSVKLLNKLPGPPTLPLIGNTVDICCSPEKFFLILRRCSREYFPIYKIWAFFTPCVFIITPEDVEIILSSTNYIEKGGVYIALLGWLGTGLLTSSGDKWHSRRKLLTQTFHFDILKEFLATFDKQSDLLVKQLETECNKRYTEIAQPITKFTLNTICVTAMGSDPSDLCKNMKQDYMSSIHKLGEYVIYRLVRPWLYYSITFFFTTTFWKQRRLQNILHLFSLSVIRKRKTDDIKYTDVQSTKPYSNKRHLALLDLLIAAQKADPSIKDEDIREEVDTFMFEGHDTTSVAICYILMLLACHQDIQEKAREEILIKIENNANRYSYENLQELKYLEMVIKESLRMYPSVPLISRINREDVRMHSGYLLPKDSEIHIMIYDMHYNPLYYPDPTKFDPDRFLPENCKNRHPYAYIPFSAGPRNCIGQRFAMLELKIVVAKILKQFYLHSVDTPSTIVFKTDLMLRTTNGIKIRLERRNI